MPEQLLKEIHCDCGKLLCRVDEDGIIWVWCKKCKKEVKLEAKSSGPKEKAYNKETLYKSAKALLDFLETVETGNSFWIDQNKKMHTCDMGYVFEFLEDVTYTFE